jgi:hypothetical protein
MSQVIFTYESIYADTFVQLISISLPENDSCKVSGVDFKDGVRDVENIFFKPLPAAPGFSRVEFRVDVPYLARFILADGTLSEVEGCVQDIYARIVIYTPLARQDLVPGIVVETRCSMVVEPSITGRVMQFAVNVNIVVRCSAKHLLGIPAVLGSRDDNDSPDLQANWTKACERFVDPVRTQFPGDFFPPTKEGGEDI